MNAGLSLVLILFLGAPVCAQAAEYRIDPVHSTVGFKVQHMVVSRVTGRFGKFSGEFRYDPKNVKTWSAKATIDAASINTDMDKRDEHLRSSDFLDAQKYPTIEFVSKRVEGLQGNKAQLIGDLTLHGVTKTVRLELEIGGTVKDPSGNEHAGFSARTKIDRKDFGLTWNKVLESGGLLVGEEVDIELNVEGLKKEAAKRP